VAARRLIASLAAALVFAGPATAQDIPPTLIPFVADAIVGAVPLREGGDASDEQWFGEDAVTLSVRNVTRPTLRPVLPDPSIATGAGVVVVPGGALVALSMGNEGMEVARALADAGIAAFVVKYRTVDSPRDADGFATHIREGVAAFLASGPESALDGEAAAREDVEAALALVSARAGEWGVDPDRVGVLGFSAGAITALNAILAEGAAPPAFAGLLYGRMAAVAPPEDAPPLFVAVAADDPLFGGAPWGLVESWRSAGLPVEFHFYDRGGHGFGMAPQGAPSDFWFAAFLAWLEARGVL
jgi:acetyl esterase/lipase